MNDLIFEEYNLSLKHNQLSNTIVANPIGLEEIDASSYWIMESQLNNICKGQLLLDGLEAILPREVGDIDVGPSWASSREEGTHATKQEDDQSIQHMLLLMILRIFVIHEL